MTTGEVMRKYVMCAVAIVLIVVGLAGMKIVEVKGEEVYYLSNLEDAEFVSVTKFWPRQTQQQDYILNDNQINQLKLLLEESKFAGNSRNTLLLLYPYTSRK